MLIICESTKLYSQNVEQRKDSISRTSAVVNDRYKPTSYLFDSTFIVSNQYLKRNMQLAKTINSAKLIYNSKDSSVFYTNTGKTILLNGTVLKGGQKNYFHINKCRKSRVKILTQETLKELYGLYNPKGAFVIICD
jgi:hypothetical protein